MLKIDLKNAYGTIRRSDILAGLREHAPALIRWFIISYGSPTQLFHAVHGHVGEVQEGVRQGDPMATIFFAIGFQAAIKRINEHVRAQHPGMPTARAWAFADDLVHVTSSSTGTQNDSWTTSGTTSDSSGSSQGWNCASTNALSC